MTKIQRIQRLYTLPYLKFMGPYILLFWLVSAFVLGDLFNMLFVWGWRASLVLFSLFPSMFFYFWWSHPENNPRKDS